MECVDLLVTWTWPPDEPAVRLLEAAARRHGVSCRVVGAAEIAAVTADVMHGRRTFRWLFDRASDEHADFIPLARWVDEQSDAGVSGPAAVNPFVRLMRAADKATMHGDLLSAGVNVPQTILLPPAATHPAMLPDVDALRAVGVPFVVKPANTTGGGNGVVLGASTIADIESARRTHPHDTYLVQETIRPAYLGDFRAWFRVFFVCGRTHLTWWDDRTHVYDPVEPDDERFFGLGILRATAETIARTCGLRFFSTELVIREDQTLVAVDYVNEMCDLRLQSVAPNGVPDRVVRAIVEDVVLFAGSQSAGQGVIP